MDYLKKYTGCLLSLSLFIAVFASFSAAQEKQAFSVISERDELNKIVPSSFYFAGLSGNTQMRNSAAAKLADKRHIIAGLIDVSGYSTDISGVYEGFFITDSPVKFGNKKLKTGAYGFGFAKNGLCNIFDLSGTQILSAKTMSDEDLKRPRPLMMDLDQKGIRLYKGKDYVLIRPR